MQHGYVGRKLKKRTARRTWITRMNASLRSLGLRYSEFISLQSQTDVKINRKVMAGLAEYEPWSFKSVIEVIKMRGERGE